MPPRKSAPAGEDDQCPTLKLTMENGPLSGQTNEFRPGSRVNIGRVVRGNTIAIKNDAAVSSKHLIIQVKAVADLGRLSWTVTDLWSSSGTFLNGQQLKPSEPAVLSDGDVLKIGEITSIKVEFEVNVDKNEVISSGKEADAGLASTSGVKGEKLADLEWSDFYACFSAHANYLRNRDDAF